jgi:hypothetical protein
MLTRLWPILAGIAIVAFVAAGLLGAVSLVWYAYGSLTGQLAAAGVADLLLSVVFLIAGAGALFAAARTARRHREPLPGRVLFVLAALVAGTCCTIIGVRGIISPDLLRAAFGAGVVRPAP